MEPDTEVRKALAPAAAVEVCSVPAAVLGEGVPAAPTPEAVDAEAALAAGGEQMTKSQQLRGILEPGLNAKNAVVEVGIDRATTRVPGEAAEAGDSSGNALGAAGAAGVAVGLENSAPKVHVPATAAAASIGNIPLGVGLSGGEQAGRASANMQTDAAADCSAGSGAAMALLVGARLQGMAGCAEGAAAGGTHTETVLSNPSSSAAVGVDGAALVEQLRPDHGWSQPAAAAHPLPSSAPAIADAATAAGASCVGVAAGFGEADLNQVAAAGAEQFRLKDTSSVQEAALEVLRLCTTLEVSVCSSRTPSYCIRHSGATTGSLLGLHCRGAQGGSRTYAVLKNVGRLYMPLK